MYQRGGNAKHERTTSLKMSTSAFFLQLHIDKRNARNETMTLGRRFQCVVIFIAS